MPLKLIPPSKKRRTPFFSVRGHHLGNAVDRSTKTDSRSLAKKILKRWQAEIERGEYQSTRPEVDSPVASLTPRIFAEAAVAYMRAGGERRFLGPAIDILGSVAITDIDQFTIDAAAARAFPKGTAAYRNRNFYTPVSAVLKHIGVEKKLRRPKGWRGKRSTSWLEPEQAFRLFKEADKINAEFGVFLRVLCYTGMRLSEALGVRLANLNLRQQMIYLPETKNGEARSVHLPPVVIAALTSHPRGLNRDPNDRLFRFHASGALRAKLNEAKEAAGIVLPRRQGGFHVFCHTYGTWMRRYGKLDTYDLVDTGRWKDASSAARYAHNEPSAAAKRADFLPVVQKRAR
jgi:integrase